MLKRLNRIAFVWNSESRRRRQRVDRRLRAEVSAAWREPSPQLRRHTIAALNDATHQPVPVTASPRAGGSAYAVAFLALIVLGAVAVRLGVTGPPAQAPVADPPAILARFDTTAFDTLIRTQIQELEGSWESSLRTEAKLIATDARNAGEYVLATLPLPMIWSPLFRPGG